MKIDRDALNHADPVAVARAAFNTIDTLQHLPRETQILGIAAAFLCLCEYLGEPAQDIFTVTKNIINGEDGRVHQFKAIAEYMKEELR